MAVPAVTPSQTATSTPNKARKPHPHHNKPAAETPDETVGKNTSAPKLATTGAVGTKLNQVA